MERARERGWKKGTVKKITVMGDGEGEGGGDIRRREFVEHGKKEGAIETEGENRRSERADLI